MATTPYRLAEEIQLILAGGVVSASFSPSINEIKISVAQVANTMFKVDYFAANLGNVEFKEVIPNGAALGLYEGIAVTSYGQRSKCTLPVKPLKLPRNMGIWSIFSPDYPDNEFIPLQMGQFNQLKSQGFLSDLLGKITYENFGLDVIFNKDLTLVGTVTTVSMRLAILDFSQYGDWDVLPLPAEQEFGIKQQVLAMYGNYSIPDKTVDPGVAEQENVPVTKQRQA